MNIQEHYKTMGVSSDISDEDLKKKHKELVKKYHPDVCKDHPNKLKEINSAYQAIQDYRKNPNPFKRANINESDFSGFSSFDLDDVFSGFSGFGGFHQSQGPKRKVENIFSNIKISFEESVLGTEKEIELNRKIKCNTCDGKGFSLKHNGCDHCNGFGRTTTQRGNMAFTSTCNKCRGKMNSQNCNDCNSEGCVSTKSKLKVKVPAGVSDKAILNLNGAGHFAHSSMFGDSYSSVLVTINVENNTKLKLNGNDVIYNLDISLLEALEGCEKTVPSIKGEKNIKIPQCSKNKDEIKIKKLGVKLIGDEVVVLNVLYPENKEKLISALKE